MEVKILKERETPLLARKRLTIEVEEKGATPSRLEVRDAIAAKQKANPKLTVIKHVYPRFGINKARVIAHIYGNEEDMKRYEDEGLLKKHVKEAPKEGNEEVA